VRGSEYYSAAGIDTHADMEVSHVA